MAAVAALPVVGKLVPEPNELDQAIAYAQQKLASGEWVNYTMRIESCDEPCGIAFLLDEDSKKNTRETHLSA